MNTDIATLLSEPFPADVIGWKPQSVTKDNKRALAVAYIDARDVMERLDFVVGIEGWQDEYTTLADGTVMCRLSVKIGGDWITKMDVGGQSDQKDAGDKHKAAVSDALKRAAVKFGIGRYIYRLPLTWCEYDADKKQFSKTPPLPSWALPQKPSEDKPPRQTANPAESAIPLEELLVKTEDALQAADLRWDYFLKLADGHKLADGKVFKIPEGWEEPADPTEVKEMTWVPREVLQRIRKKAAEILLENEAKKKKAKEPEHAA